MFDAFFFFIFLGGVFFIKIKKMLFISFGDSIQVSWWLVFILIRKYRLCP